MDKSIKCMKKQKILITGVLGYIARGFCELYKNDYKIIGIDNNFIPDKVKWLVDNGIEYYHRDLFNIKDLLNDIDFVIHTAGITAVPTVKSQSNPTIDADIIKIGVDGTRELINNINDNCKIIFLSTHVIFEGLKTSESNITEGFEPCPELAYATSKAQSEKDLIYSNKKFTTLRLASVYGYNDCVRWKILPNLFSKMTAVDGKLKVFGNGNNIKPLVGVVDVCAAIDWLMQSDYNGHTFNIVNDHKTVKEIAEICNLYNPNLKIEFTSDEIPNLGYSLSNEKLLKTGFRFNQSLNNSIEEMINLWKNE